MNTYIDWLFYKIFNAPKTHYYVLFSAKQDIYVKRSLDKNQKEF